MCTTIFYRAAVTGSGKGPQGWFRLDHVNVGYDHPFHAQVEHAVNIDFGNEATGARVAVELTRESARELVAKLTAALDEADCYEDD
jgi:hypothetical protein